MREIKLRLVTEGVVIGYEICTDAGWFWAEKLRGEAGNWKYGGTYGEMCDREQFTGLHDAKGREIYEGDRVIDTAMSEEPYTVKWSDTYDDCGWYFPGWNVGRYESEGMKHVTVIGNIHEGEA